jgi:hypothetical protein
MTQMSSELSQAIQKAGGEPLRIIDPSTKQTYVVVREEVFERVRALLDVDEDDPRVFYPLLADMSPEDWEDGSVYGLPERP